MSGTCPRCGARTLFAGMLRFAPQCRACGLDFDSFNVGDGGAAFGTLIIGAVVILGAGVVQALFAPSLLVQMLIWVPLSTLLVIWFLRGAKTRLMKSEYVNAAREGRLQK